MKIKELFLKDINRNIETVIKADDNAHISDEVAEYVVTNEIANKVRDFFDAYNNYSGINGVWISGFFGSGKSHLLKILSYVLENKAYDGYKSGELFAEKIEDDEMLKGDVLAATRIPSESILFNIDQQAQITSKTDENAILSVFYKVFYDHLGYYGFRPHVAEFEMSLDKQGKYADFKKKFLEKHGKPWEEARIDYYDPLVDDDVKEVLGKLNNVNTKKYEGYLDGFEDRHTESIEDFCQRVYSYIKQKPAAFRLNFFVDEVGQYISNNTRLMLNLQTIAETLATITQGRSWILVTSQEDMEKVVGDMNKSQQNDFSRIQARFQIKIPLTSANVDEVIEKRLLKKKEHAQEFLMDAFQTKKALLSTLLSFSDVGVQFKAYQGAVDYANKYPLAPYQFDLFQQCRRALSSHNAFQGKHASVGERSMLGVFQQVVKKIQNKDDDTLVSFDLMFEGVRNELKGEIQSTVILAERNLGNAFAIRLLKALFLVKYYKNFKPTPRNISVLMLDNVQVDLKAHEKQVSEALNMLENQNYVQRNGDVYEFLTDDEKDVEEEIKNTEIDDTSVTQLLKEIFFDEVIRDNKIKYFENKQDYEFTGKIDGALMGREKELEIDIITPHYNDYENITFIQSQTMGSTGMKIVLPSNPVFLKDLKLYLQTNKYVKQSQSTTNRPEVRMILQEKSRQNTLRRKNLVLLANQLLAGADVYMNGSKQVLGATTDGKTKVVNAFQNLIKTVYPSLKMLGNVYYSEDTLKNIVRSRQDDLFGTDDSTISEAESEVYNFVYRRKQNSDRTTLYDLKGNFIRRPYGWYPNAIWSVAARLYKRGKIELKRDANLLEDEDALNSFLNSSYFNNTLLEPQETIDPQTVKKLKQVFADAFDESCPFKEGKDVAVAFKDRLKEMAVTVDTLLAKKRDYPFLEILEPFAEKLQRWSKNDYSYFLKNISDFEDDLLDAKEDLLDPIKRFMNGEQKNIYDHIKRLIESNTANVDYIEGNEFDTLKTLIASRTPYKGNAILIAKAAKDSLTNKVAEALKKEKESAIETIEKTIDTIKNNEDYQKLDEQGKQEIIKPFLKEITKLQNQKFIAVIRDVKEKVVNKLLPAQLNEMMRLLTKDDESGEGNVNEPKPHYVALTRVKINYPKSELKNETDVEEYIKAYKKALLEQIKNNRRISI